MTCPLPKAYRNKVPTSVSIVNAACDKPPTNNIKVTYNLQSDKEPKKKFAVCMKALTFMDDRSAQLVEWIEILKALGAEQIFFYILENHPNIYKVRKQQVSKTWGLRLSKFCSLKSKVLQKFFRSPAEVLQKSSTVVASVTDTHTQTHTHTY